MTDETQPTYNSDFVADVDARIGSAMQRAGEQSEDELAVTVRKIISDTDEGR